MLVLDALFDHIQQISSNVEIIEAWSSARPFQQLTSELGDSHQTETFATLAACLLCPRKRACNLRINKYTCWDQPTIAAAMQQSGGVEGRTGQAHSFLAAGKSPAQIDAVESLLDRAMGFDKAHVRVDLQILRHRRVGVEPYCRQATAPGLADGMIHELAP